MTFRDDLFDVLLLALLIETCKCILSLLNCMENN